MGGILRTRSAMTIPLRSPFNGLLLNHGPLGAGILADPEVARRLRSTMMTFSTEGAGEELRETAANAVKERGVGELAMAETGIGARIWKGWGVCKVGSIRELGSG